jgi:hypothetical protein
MKAIVILTAIGIILILIVAYFNATLPAAAHSWYEPACCSSRDCEPISFDSVTESAEGWTVHYQSKLGFPVMAFTPRGKERHSQDGRFHGCATSTRFLCLYVPVNS